MSKKKIYTGIHLLAYKDNLTQFGMVDAWANVEDLIPTLRINFGKKIIEKIKNNDEGVSIELTMEEAKALTDELRSIIERIQLLIILVKQDKLSDKAFYPDK